MRGFILMAALIALPACAAETLDFIFYDGGGKESGRTYHSRSLHADFEWLYDFKSTSNGRRFTLFLFLIEGPNRDDPQLQEQAAIVDRLRGNHDEIKAPFDFIYVFSQFAGDYTRTNGYHVPKDEAQRLAGDLKRFRVTLLSPTGVVLKQSERVLSMETIKQVLKDHTDTARSR